MSTHSLTHSLIHVHPHKHRNADASSDPRTRAQPSKPHTYTHTNTRLGTHNQSQSDDSRFESHVYSSSPSSDQDPSGLLLLPPKEVSTDFNISPILSVMETLLLVATREVRARLLDDTRTQARTQAHMHTHRRMHACTHAHRNARRDRYITHTDISHGRTQ